MRIALESALYAGVAALVVNTVSVPFFLFTGIGLQWILVMPLIVAAMGIKPTWLGFTLAYLVGYLQFFILFWIIIGLKLRKDDHTA